MEVPPKERELFESSNLRGFYNFNFVQIRTLVKVAEGFFQHSAIRKITTPDVKRKRVSII